MKSSLKGYKINNIQYIGNAPREREFLKRISDAVKSPVLTVNSQVIAVIT